MNQFDVRRQQIFQPKTINSVRMPTAHFHNPVMALRIGKPPDLLRSLCNDLRFPKLIDKFHNSYKSAVRSPDTRKTQFAVQTRFLLQTRFASEHSSHPNTVRVQTYFASEHA